MVKQFFYLQPTLGGNEFLRGFERYRFYDQSAFHAAVEHRWYVFSNMHAALFFEAGKVAPKVSQLNFHKLEYAGGIGFRFTIQDTVIMRIDNAVSREDTGSCGRSAICGEETMNRAAIITFTAGLMLPGFPTRRSSFPTTHSKGTPSGSHSRCEPARNERHLGGLTNRFGKPGERHPDNGVIRPSRSTPSASRSKARGMYIGMRKTE